ncbi:MAG: AAA family ATPase [Proteobacteria bacterium]|nr:AAA family ATPase [Pseudomonadota bacterium]
MIGSLVTSAASAASSAATSVLAPVVTVGVGTFCFLGYKYPNEVRSFTNQKLIALVKSEWIDKGRLNDDIRYILEFDERMAQVEKTLSKERKEALSCLIKHYVRLLNEGQSSQFLNNFRQGINLLFDLTIDFHEPIKDEVKRRLKETVSHDYPQVDVDINVFIEQLAQYINDRESNPKPNPLLLIGPPGVGKTRFVEEILSAGLNLPVFRFSFAKERSEHLAGEKNANLCNKFDEGVIVQALVKAVRNKKRAPVVIFLDDICAAFTKEGNKVEESKIISWLTEVLDPDLEEVTLELFNRYSTAEHTINGLKISPADFVFVVAANSEHFVLTEGLQRRLRSRVRFPAMTEDKKIEIAQTHSENLERKAKVKLSESDKAEVRQIAIRDPYPGAGTMKDTINKWYAAKKGGDKFNIEAYYQRLEESSKSVVTKAPMMFTPGFDGQRAQAELSIDQLSELLNQRLSMADPKQREEFIRKLANK